MSTPISLAAPFRKSFRAVSHALLACPLIAVLVAFAAGQTDKNPILLQPTRVDAGKAFDLEVLSLRWSCGATYSHVGAARSGSRLIVSFLVTENPAVVCPAILRPYGPKVPVPALPAGRYDVHASLLMPCQVLPQPCDVPVRVERVGYLTSGPQAEADWFASPVMVPAGNPFSLRILSDRYGNCQTRFAQARLEVREGRIVASFMIVTDSTLVCVTDIRPHGPAFPVEALKAGKYPVDVIEVPQCQTQPPICPIPENEARTVDTLWVAGPSAVKPRPQGAGARTGTRLERGRVKLEGAGARNVQGRVLGEREP